MQCLQEEDTRETKVRRRSPSNEEITRPIQSLSQKPSNILEFEQQVLKELSILNLNLDDISESVNVLINNEANKSQKPSIPYEVPDIVELFPLNDESLI
jgi:hypothetical protein